MGYYVELVDAHFRIPDDPRVLQAWKDANVRLHGLKRGGSSNGERWFSWMPASFDQYSSVSEVLEDMGFEGEMSFPGTIWLRRYDSKQGQEALLLSVIAPFVADGDYLVFRGEDGEVYRLEVRGGRLLRSYGRVEYVFDDGEPLTEDVYQWDAATKTTRVVTVDPTLDKAGIDAALAGGE